MNRVIKRLKCNRQLHCFTGHLFQGFAAEERSGSCIKEGAFISRNIVDNFSNHHRLVRQNGNEIQI